MDTAPQLVAAAERTGGTLRTDRDGNDSVWIENVSPSHVGVLSELGLVEVRRLHQMRRRLPVPPEVLRPDESNGRPSRTRAFVPGRDDAAWVELNNHAFEWHPDQSHQTLESLRDQMTEPWFDPDGFRILEIDGEMAGFCWTKVHPTEPLIGEIYVIGVSPRLAGRGLGRELTLDGLSWLHDVAHTPIGMLYVESTNAAAIELYQGLGFEIHGSDSSFVPAT